jgi:hypothetical protein
VTKLAVHRHAVTLYGLNQTLGLRLAMKDPHDPNTLELTLTELEPTTAKRGRPAKHASAAARQKAYRERQKAQGLREVKRYVRDVREVAPLRSGR